MIAVGIEGLEDVIVTLWLLLALVPLPSCPKEEYVLMGVDSGFAAGGGMHGRA